MSDKIHRALTIPISTLINGESGITGNHWVRLCDNTRNNITYGIGLTWDIEEVTCDRCLKILEASVLTDKKDSESKLITIKKPYIICAAIWFNDGTKHESQPKNIDVGYVVCGRRHDACYRTYFIANKLYENSTKKHKHIQGFVTSDNMFVNRGEAAEIAFAANQIAEPTSCLMSEDLY